MFYQKKQKKSIKELINMLKTVIYALYSSDKQNEQSIEGQIHECKQFAKTHDNGYY